MQRDWRLLCSALASLLAFFGLFAIWRGFRRDAEFAINGCPPNVFCEVDHPLFVRWPRLFGQFGGEVKLIPGFDYAASRSVSAVGASPDSGRISFTP